MFEASLQVNSPAQFYHAQGSEVSHTSHSEASALAGVREMLALLGRQNDPDEAVHLRAIHPVTKKAESLTLAIFHQAFSLNRDGWNLYLVPNRGGNSKVEITECCALFFEYDDRPKQEQLDIWKGLGLPEPTFQNDTGGKSIHQYFVLDPSISKDQWEELQRRLLALAKESDQNLKDPCRVMNCAGSFKYASQKHVDLGLAEEAGELMGISQIISSNGTTYTVADLEAVLPSLEGGSYLPKIFSKPQKDLSDAEQEHNKDKALEALRCLPAADYEDYGSWLKVGMALHSIDEGFLSNWVEWCRPMSNFDEPEFVQKWESFSEKEPGEGVGIGTLIKEAKKHGYSEPVRAIAPPEHGGLPGLIEAVGSFQEPDENGEQRPAPRMNAGAVMTLLEKRLGSHLKLNDLARVYEFDGVPLPEDETMVSYGDMQQKGWNIEQKAWLDGLLRVAQKYRYDPVLDYLQYLEKAADVEPVDINKIATNYLETESDLSDQMMKVALLGAVARRFEPGCQFDSVVVLKGDQGIRKSTFWKTLCSPAWFCDSTPNDTKEMKMNMHSCWIFELAELENVTSKKGVGELKAIITIASDMIKKPYGRNVERDDRRSIMVASVNGDDFLRDPSGNRRFQVISLPQKAQKKEFIPVELVARDRDRIWKAAIVAYRAGEKPMLSLEHQELSNQKNKGYLPEDLCEQKLDKWLSGLNEYGRQESPPRQCFTTFDALKGLGFGLDEERKLGRREQMRMAALLQTKGFLKDAQQKTINGVRGYYWRQSE